MKQINAEYIPYMHAYRLYTPDRAHQTVAYVDSLGEAERNMRNLGYGKLVLCDADTMHVEEISDFYF